MPETQAKQPPSVPFPALSQWRLLHGRSPQWKGHLRCDSWGDVAAGNPVDHSLLMLFDESPTTVTTTFVFGLIDQYWGGLSLGWPNICGEKSWGKSWKWCVPGCAWRVFKVGNRWNSCGANGKILEICENMWKLWCLDMHDDLPLGKWRPSPSLRVHGDLDRCRDTHFGEHISGELWKTFHIQDIHIMNIVNWSKLKQNMSRSNPQVIPAWLTSLLSVNAGDFLDQQYMEVYGSVHSHGGTPKSSISGGIWWDFPL